MAWTVRNGLHQCRVDERFIFLDRHADRYFLLGKSPSADFAAYLAGSASQPVIDRLTGLGLLVTTQAISEPAQALTLIPPTDSMMDVRQKAAPLFNQLQAVTEILRVRWSLKRRGFHRIISELERKNVLHSEAPTPSLYLPIASTMQRTSLYATSVDRCLLRSLAVMRLLHRRGLSAKFVIGVTLPFAAHCWVQWRGTVVNDRLETVQNYTPLLVL